MDLGGTFLKVAVKTPRQIIQNKAEVASLVIGHNLTNLFDFLTKLRGSWNIKNLVFGVAGLLDRERGVVTDSPNLQFLNGFPLKRELEKHLGIPVILENDAGLAALGEYRYGNGRDASVFLCLTLGTGLGAGLVLNGELYHGFSGMAVEPGHMVIEKNGRLCRCGRRGCLEAYVSSYALEERYFEKTGERVKSEEVIQRALREEAPARELMEEVSEDLAVGTVNMIHLLNPDQIVFTGGMVDHYPLLVSRTEEKVRGLAFPGPLKGLVIERGVLKEFSGTYGALALAEDCF
jgi:glucokinase